MNIFLSMINAFLTLVVFFFVSAMHPLNFAKEQMILYLVCLKTDTMSSLLLIFFLTFFNMICGTNYITNVFKIMFYYFILFQNWGNMTRKKKLRTSKPVHYMFIILYLNKK